MDQPEISITVRPAAAGDTPAVLEFTRRIWEGEDYVPQVWETWLQDPEGVLAVAEAGGQVVGLAKLTHLGEGAWWLEGLRTNPDYEGRGVASALHDFLVGYWEQHGDGALRLSTSSQRVPVHHLCERTGFGRGPELAIYRAGANPDRYGFPFTRLDEDDLATALRKAQASESLALMNGLVDIGWEWKPLDLDALRQSFQAGRAWRWRDREGLLTARQELDQDEQRLVLELVACSLAGLPTLLKDATRLAVEQDCRAVVWFAPDDPAVRRALYAAGYERIWDNLLYIYTKEHPGGKLIRSETMV